jgi:sn-glycerol 3-phosphate transport system ATP-binding protein
MIAGLETITSGDISIGGRSSTTSSPAERDIAMVFQNYALYPHMTVYDNMAYGLKQPGHAEGDEIDRRSPRPPRILQLEDYLDRKPARSRAASASASPWAAPSCAIPRPSSCSTSRCPTSTPSCACRCALEIKPSCTSLGATFDLRHPRPGRGDDPGRPHRRHERGCRIEQIGTPAGGLPQPRHRFVAGSSARLPLTTTHWSSRP